ncbi:MAG: AAA family ATPase [Desulfarculus sp.]|nr:AAA family ATPase [Desulfarculus sp.]
MADFPILTDLAIDGFRLFRDFRVKVGDLEVLVGANGSGKSSFFFFFYVLKKGMDQEIPPGIVPRGVGQTVFNNPKNEQLNWRLEVRPTQGHNWIYKGSLIGPKGNPTVMVERVFTSEEGNPISLSIEHGHGGYVVAPNPEEGKKLLKLIDTPNRFTLSLISSPDFGLPYNLKNYIGGWRFYRSFSVSKTVISRPVLVEQEPALREDSVLCLHPKPPTLICIDEPELGLHPRVLPLLAGLFQKASQRTQVLIATHSSYFLSQFPLESIAVMRKEEGRAVWKKPADSQTLKGILDDFGSDEIERLHISDELEVLS